MSKRCPKCGSYNTDPIILGKAGNIAIGAGKLAVSLAAALAVSPLGHAIAHRTGEKLEEKLDDSIGEFNDTKCNNCGYHF